MGAGALAVAGSAVAVAAVLSGGGAQPEDVMPAEAFAMVKLDLDPAAGQKLAVYRLAKRFPSLADDVRDEDQIKDELLSALLRDMDELDYETEVQPWIGDRVAVAAMPAAEEPEPLVAMAFTDRSGAEAAMEKLQASEDEEFFYGFSEKADYLLVGTSQASVDAAVSPERTLADTDAWDEGMDALDGDQIVTAWADLSAVWAALPDEAREQAAEAYGLDSGGELTGTVVAGLHAAADHLEVVGRSVDVRSPFQLGSVVGGKQGTGMVQELPADTVAALSVTGLGEGLAELFETTVGADDPLGLTRGAQGFGLTLPDDLRTLLGEETLAAAFGESGFGVRSRTSDPDAAYDALQGLAGLISGGQDPGQVLRRLEDGVAVGSSPQALDAISGSDGGLGGSAEFEKALPDAGDAGFLAYVDVARALEMAGLDLGGHSADLAQLQSLGISGSGDESSSTFRLRLTVRE